LLVVLLVFWFFSILAVSTGFKQSQN